MRVLILADDCNPEWPSLPVVGYNAARAIAQHVDVVLATHVRNRENIEKQNFGNVKVRYIDNEYIARPLFKFAQLLRGGTEAGWTTAVALSYPSYLAFEWEVWNAFKDELRNGKFDLVHRLTPMSPTLPSPMAAWSPVPFVLGPLNGGLKWPAAFRQELAREREWLTYVRDLYRMLPYQRSTYRRSAALLAAFDHTINDLPTLNQHNAINFPEIGIDPEVFDQVVERHIPAGGAELAGPGPVDLGHVGRCRVGDQGGDQLWTDVVPGKRLEIDMDAGLRLEVGGERRGLRGGQQHRDALAGERLGVVGEGRQREG